MPLIKFLALLLIIVGAVNWGLWGVFQYDLVADLFKGNTTFLARMIYTIVGVAGIYGISFFFCKEIYKCSCRKCNKPEEK